VKVGRAALDEDAIRLIEEHNPDIEFDWTRILKGQAPDPAIERRSAPRPARAPQQPARPPEAAAAAPMVPSPTDLEPQQEVPISAAAARLGSEGLARLRGRYAEVMARITDRVQDADRQAELKTTADRLNPDAWVTESDVVAALDAYEATFESLRSIVGHRRRRGGKGRHTVSSHTGQDLSKGPGTERAE
jgi:hypothetical protein